MVSSPQYWLAPLLVVINMLEIVHAVSCTSGFVPLSISAQNQRFNVSAFQTQLQAADFFRQAVIVGSNLTSQITLPGVNHIKATYNIWTKTCIPKDWNGVVEILVHGVGATHEYFEFADDPSLSYIDLATARGDAVVFYDRLGVGKSDFPDALNVVQSAVDIDTLYKLILHVKSDARFAKAKTFIGLGHSYGNILVSGIANLYPTLLNKLILTGFTPSTASLSLLFLTWSPWIASFQDPIRFSRYSNDSHYLATETPPHDFTTYFDGAGYYPELFASFTERKGAFSLGQILTLTIPTESWPVKKFSGSVLVVTGDHDLAFCGGNCWQKPTLTNGTSLVSDVAGIYPAIKQFSTFIPANTGHATFHHLSAPQVFSVIDKWLKGTYR